MIDAPAPTSAARASRPVLVTGARVLAAVALHAVGFALLAWTIDPVISETGTWGWPTAQQVEVYGLFWLQTALPVSLVWGAYVTGRAAMRRRIEGTAFVLSAVVVAIVAFALAVPLLLLEVPVQAPGMAITAWFLAAAAGVVVVAEQVRRERRERAVTPAAVPAAA